MNTFRATSPRSLLAWLVGAWLTLSAATPALARPNGRELQGVVNLNTATLDELTLLPGVGPARAEQILAYRRVRPFRTVEELVRIKGVGRKTVKRLRPHLTINGPSTARLARPAVEAEPSTPAGAARMGTSKPGGPSLVVPATGSEP